MSDDKRQKIDDVDPDAPPSEEEVRESKKLRDALEQGTDPIAAALQAAWAPAPIDALTHAQIIDRTTLLDGRRGSAEGGTRDVATPEEMKLAALIRDFESEDDMVVALKAAWNPAPIDAEAHRTIVDRATARAVVQLKPSSRRMNIAIVTTTTAFALAASVIVWITAGPTIGLKGELAIAKARSTQPLFDEPFKTGEASARIDRIAMARSSDYRDNFFARRGVK